MSDVETLIAEAMAVRDRASDVAWLLSNAFIVLTMQAGFGMLEQGCVSSKAQTNIMMKNEIDLAYGAVAFFVSGWALAYGKSSHGLFGSDTFLLDGMDPKDYAMWVFQFAFAATAATIISGAVAGRMKFVVYMIISIYVTGLVYPIGAHWAWNGDGVLAKMGFIDFAGCGPVHMTGGVMGMVASWSIGPRAGVFLSNGAYVPTRSNPMNMLFGTILLFMGWFAFNCGSTLTLAGDADLLASKVAVNTAIAGGSATLTGSLMSVFTRWKSSPHATVDPFETATATLSGLVGITAGCAVVTPAEAFIIGSVTAAATFWSPKIMEKLVIDDPVGVFPVHVVAAGLGLVWCGLFADAEPVLGNRAGLFHGGGFHLLGVQVMGLFMYVFWGGITVLVFLWALWKFTNPRVSLEAETMGLDEAEHNIVAMLVQEEQEFEPTRSGKSLKSVGSHYHLRRHSQESIVYTKDQVDAAEAVHADPKRRQSIVRKKDVDRHKDAEKRSKTVRVLPVHSAKSNVTSPGPVALTGNVLDSDDDRSDSDSAPVVVATGTGSGSGRGGGGTQQTTTT